MGARREHILLHTVSLAFLGHPRAEQGPHPFPIEPRGRAASEGGEEKKRGGEDIEKVTGKSSRFWAAITHLAGHLLSAVLGLEDPANIPLVDFPPKLKL
jgi:hypothetical protein